MPDTVPGFVATKYKQPGEEQPSGKWSVDFSPDLDTAEVIVSATITVYDAAGADQTSVIAPYAVVIDVTGKLVTTSYQGGLDGEDYAVEVVATSDLGGVYKADFRIIVREV